MTQLEKFTALLDEMNVHYTVSTISYGGQDVASRVSIPAGSKGFANYSGDDGTQVVFSKDGTCISWF